MSGEIGTRRPTAARMPVSSLVVLAVAATVTFLRIRSWGLLGFDSYPMILTSRVRSVDDVLQAFVQPMMEDRFRGAFYRPLVNLSFALDEAFWHHDPIGYQLTAAVLFGFAGWAVFLLAYRLAPDLRLVSWTAAALFLLHPLAVEVVPVPARRAEILACAFLAVACALVVEPGRIGRRRWLAATACGVLAMAAKEVALLGALPAFAIGMSAPCPTTGSRWRSGLRSASPLAVAALGMVAARLLVLGSMGGYEVSGPLSAPARLPAVVGNTLVLLAVPQPALRTAGFGALAVLAVLAAGVGLWRLERGERRRLGRVAAVAVAWLAMTVLAFAAAGTVQAWYMLLPTVSWALLLAVAVEIPLIHLARHRRATAAASLVVLLAVAAHARYSFWWTDYRQWGRATRASRDFLVDLEGRLAAADPGDVVLAPPMPRWVAVPLGEPWVWGAAVLDVYSIQAWVELTLPQRSVRVAAGREGEESFRPAADEVLVRVETLLPGFEAPFPPR